MTHSQPLLRLLQLASPALPVGAYTYSQGLEWAVEAGTVRDEASTEAWVGDLLAFSIGRYEAPMLTALMAAWAASDRVAIARLNDGFLASRESAELQAETRQMGYSLLRLVQSLADPGLVALERQLTRLREANDLAFPTAWAGLAATWGIPLQEAVAAYLWAWCENQVMAAVKAVPLGQAAGQRLLLRLGQRIPAVLEVALVLPEEDWSNLTPAFALASACHETQYSRLFRS